MADISDVEKAVVSLLAQYLFPNVDYVPGTPVLSSVGVTVRLGRRFQPQNVIATDTSKGRKVRGFDQKIIGDNPSTPAPPVDSTLIADVVVEAASGMSRDEDRYLRHWEVASRTPITLTATVSGSTVTWTGSCTTGQGTGVAYGHTSYPYRLQATDTPQTVAQAVAAKIAGATVSGSTVTLPTLLPVSTGVVADGVLIEEISRRGQVYRITVLAPDPDSRDALGNVIEVAMMTARSFTMPDTSTTLAPVFTGAFGGDDQMTAPMWRRDLTYRIEHAVTRSITVPAYLFGSRVINDTETMFAPQFGNAPVSTAPRDFSWDFSSDFAD